LTENEEVNSTPLGQRLRAERKAQGKTQGQLARLAGIKQQAVSALERGIAQETRAVVPLAVALGVSPEWLASGKGPKHLADWDLAVDVSAQPADVALALRELVAALESGRIPPGQFIALVRALTMQGDP
jgi:transcriptional regulator with XRE-family HTH domain